MHKHKLQILTRGGLANKLRTLLTGMYAADETERDLEIGWESCRGCRMFYDDFFMPIDNVRIEREDTKIIPNFERIYNTLGNFEDIKKYDNNQNLLSVTCGNINCGSISADDIVKKKRHLVSPKKEIADEIEEYAAKHFNNKTIGFHIRSAEHFLNITSIKAREEIIDKIPNEIGIYIAVDNIEVKEYLLNKYGNRIIYKEKSFGFDNNPGMRDAVIDMYLLNRCAKIYGTRTSSYSWAASIIKKDTETIML